MRSDGPYGHLYEQITEFASLYFGDNIEWDKLEEFNMAELYDTKNIKEESNMIADELKRARAIAEIGSNSFYIFRQI